MRLLALVVDLLAELGWVLALGDRILAGGGGLLAERDLWEVLMLLAFWVLLAERDFIAYEKTFLDMEGLYFINSILYLASLYLPVFTRFAFFRILFASYILFKFKNCRHSLLEIESLYIRKYSFMVFVCA